MIATESGHWYTRDGQPCYTVKAKDGNDRPTTLRDARKLLLLPSVTTITRVIAKPALTNWLIGQGVWQALTLPRVAGETDDAFIRRAVEAHSETGRLAAERGTALHGALERGDTTGQWAEHVTNTNAELLAIGVDLSTAKVEHSFASPLGYGGKVDAHGACWVLDFKSKDAIGDKTAKDFAYDEHAMQLAAYESGIYLSDDYPRLLNVFVGVKDAKVVIKEWTYAEAMRGWQLFLTAFKLWKLQHNYNPNQQEENQ